MSSFLTSLPNTTHSQIHSKLDNMPYKSPSQILSQIEHQYVRYSVEHNSKYNDIDEIEQYYISLANSKYKIFNLNRTKISELKSINNSLSNQIQFSLLNHFPLTSKTLLRQYDSEISKIKYLIKIKTHEQETYKNIYTRLFNTNSLIKIRIQSELEYADMYSHQYNQYQILKSHALLTFKSQNKKFEKMKNYNEVSSVQMKRKLYQKAKIVNTLEYQIDLIKQDVKNTEKKLRKCNKLEQQMQSNIILQKKKYEVYYNDYLWYRKIYSKSKMGILRLLKMLRIKNMDCLINKSITLKGKYQSLLSQFNFYNNELSNLNYILTKVTSDLINVQQQISQKQIVKKKKQQNEINNVETIKIKHVINEINLNSSHIKLNCDKKKLVLQSVILFLLKNIRKLSECGAIIEISNANTYLNNIMNIVLKTNKDLTFNYDNLNENTVLKLCLILRKCFVGYFHLFYSSLNTIITEHIRYQPNIYFDNKYNVIDLFNVKFIKLYYDNVKLSFKQEQNKNRIMKQKEKKLFSNLNTVETKSDKRGKRKEIKKSSIYHNFISYLGKRPSFLRTKHINKDHLNKSDIVIQNHINKSYVCKHPRQIMKLMDKYKNNLVIDDCDSFVNNNQKSLKKREMNTKMKILTINNLNKNNNNKINQLQCPFPKVKYSNIDNSLEYDDDSEIINKVEDKTKNENIKSPKIFLHHRKKRYEFFKKNPEMSIINERLNDLHILDIGYGNGMTTYNKIDNIDFSEAFYNFEKKYLKKSNVQSSYSITNLKKIGHRNKSLQSLGNSSNDNVLLKDKKCVSLTTLHKDVKIKYDIDNSNSNFAVSRKKQIRNKSFFSFHEDKKINALIYNNLANILNVDAKILKINSQKHIY